MSESSPATFPVTTTFALDGMVIERDLGLTFGLVVRSMGVAKSFTAGFTAMRQGEVPQYTQLLEDSRRHAIDRMIDNARLLGANAVIAMRFDSSEIGQQLTEIVAYGTAVVVRPAGLPCPVPRPAVPGGWLMRPAANGWWPCSASITRSASSALTNWIAGWVWC